MNNDSREILDKMINDGKTYSDNDVTCGSETGFVFDYMIKNYSYFLDDNPEEIYTPKLLKKGKILHKLVTWFGKLFLRTPQIVENRANLLKDDESTFINKRDGFENDAKLPEGPAIYISNHGFKDDILASLLAIKKRTYLLFGNLPMFYGSVDGYLLSKNGAILVNRKVSSSKHAAVDKCKYLLEHGQNILMFPEGSWSKKADGTFLDFYRGFYNIAKKEDGSFYPIVPIVHYVSSTYEKGKSNPIHTIVDDPIYVDGMTEEEAIEYIRDRMFTWYWKLMEKFGVSTREDVLEGFDTPVDAWEHELTERLKTAAKYDSEIETRADLQKHDNPSDVWGPIANANISPENIQLVLQARKKLSDHEKNDFQHRF